MRCSSGRSSCANKVVTLWRNLSAISNNGCFKFGQCLPVLRQWWPLAWSLDCLGFWNKKRLPLLMLQEALAERKFVIGSTVFSRNMTGTNFLAPFTTWYANFSLSIRSFFHRIVNGFNYVCLDQSKLQQRLLSILSR